MVKCKPNQNTHWFTTDIFLCVNFNFQTQHQRSITTKGLKSVKKQLKKKKMKINDDSWAPVEGLLPAKTQTPPSTQGLIWTWAHKTPSDSGPHHHQNPLPSACSTDHHRTSPPTPEEQSSFSDSQKWWRPYCCPSADWSHCRAHSSVPHPPTCGPSEARNPGSLMGPGMPLWRSNQAIKQRCVLCWRGRELRRAK